MPARFSGRSFSFLFATSIVLCVVLLYQWEGVFIVGLATKGLNSLIVNVDFSNYWVAGKLLKSFDATVIMDPKSYLAHAREILGDHYKFHTWSYPPHYLLLVWPLSFLGYKTGLIVFLLTTFALFAVSCRRLFGAEIVKDRLFWALLFPAILFNVVATQNGFLTSALLLLALAFRLEGRQLIAGFFLACLTIKPQLGILIPVYLVLEQDWRTALAACVWTLVLAGISIFIFGLDAWIAYFKVTAPFMTQVMLFGWGAFTSMMPTFFMSARVLGIDVNTAWTAQIIIAVILFTIFLYVMIRTNDDLIKLFFLASFTLLVVPYAFNYDMCAVVALAAALLLRQRDGKVEEAVNSFWSRSVQLAVLLLAISPVIMISLAKIGLPIGPLLILVPGIFLLMRERENFRRRPERASATIP